MRSSWLVVLALAACGDDGGGKATDSDAPIADAPLEDAAPPIFDTTPDTWVWVDVPGMHCGNGTPSGVGINRSTLSSDVFVYYQGGGACWDATTCFVAKTAVHVEDTYDAARFAAEYGNPVIDRSNPANQLARATAIVVPYCTGDLHAGTRMATYDVGGTPRALHHVGGTNTEALVAALRGTFGDVDTLFIAGTSAGGYGATFNFHHFTDAWPDAGAHLLQDSSPFVPVRANYALMQSAWALQFPPDCTDCATTFPAVVDAVAARHPDSRIGLLHFDNDEVIRFFFGYGADSLVPATTALLAAQYSHPNTAAFVAAGTDHTMLGRPGQTVNGVTLLAWVQQWVSGDPAWTTVRP